MRTAILVAALCAAYSLVAATHRDSGGPDIHFDSAVITLAFYPLVILSGLLVLFGLAYLPNRKTRLGALLVVLLSLPLPAVAVYRIGSHLNRRKSAAWPELAIQLGDHLLDYHKKSPNSFDYVGNSDEVFVSGFAEYLTSLSVDNGASHVPSLLRVSGREVIDLWGRPVRCALDRDRDGYIELPGRRVNTSGIVPPDLEYTVAVAVYLSHPDNGDIRPHVRRR